jgi:hypothetical protein
VWSKSPHLACVGDRLAQVRSVPIFLEMNDWKSACEVALQAAFALGIESPDLKAALQQEDLDLTMMALGPLLLMLEGARCVLISVSPALSRAALLAQVGVAKVTALEAFEMTSSVECPPMGEGACSVADSVGP